MKTFKLKYLLQAWWLFVIMIAVAAEQDCICSRGHYGFWR